MLMAKSQLGCPEISFPSVKSVRHRRSKVTRPLWTQNSRGQRHTNSTKPSPLPGCWKSFSLPSKASIYRWNLDFWKCICTLFVQIEWTSLVKILSDFKGWTVQSKQIIFQHIFLCRNQKKPVKYQFLYFFLKQRSMIHFWIKIWFNINLWDLKGCTFIWI